MIRNRTLFFSALAVMALAACGGPSSGRGFSLPAGNLEQGATTFVELGCNSCHTIVGQEDTQESVEAVEMSVPLGGKVFRISSHGELVTGIINPSHRISKSYLGDVVNEDGSSRMVAINDVMSVTQLVDLVEYLQSHYELEQLEPTYYRPYGY